MKERHVTSNAIKKVGFDAETGLMEVEFHNGYRYRLHGVSAGQHAKFVNADSVGDFWRNEFMPYPNDYKITRLQQSKKSRAADEEPEE